MKKKDIISILAVVLGISYLVLKILININKDDTILSNKEQENLNEIVKNLEQNQTTQFLPRHPKFEILKKIYFDSDSLLYERTLISESEDTLEKEDIVSKTIYSYDIHRNLIKVDYYINSDEGTRIGSPKPILYSISSNYDGSNRLIKSTFKDYLENKLVPYYDAKYENDKVIESIKHGVQNSFKTSYFYNKNGILVKTISQWLNFGYTPEQKLYEYSDKKLIKESIYYFDTDLQNYILKGIYKYSYKNNLLVQKSYLDYDSWTGKVRKDSTFKFKYDKSYNLIEEKVTAIQNKSSIYKKRYAVIKLIKYKYNKNNRLIESIKFGTDKYGAIDKKKIDKKLRYVYDNQNRIIQEVEEGEFFGKATYKYYYNTLN